MFLFLFVSCQDVIEELNFMPEQHFDVAFQQGAF